MQVVRPVLLSWGRWGDNGADQENGMLDHCPGNSLVNAQIFDYEVLFNAHADRVNDLVQVFEGGAALWCKVCPLTHRYNITDTRMFKYSCLASKRLLAFTLKSILFQSANQKNDNTYSPRGSETCTTSRWVCAFAITSATTCWRCTTIITSCPSSTKNILDKNGPYDNCREEPCKGDGPWMMGVARWGRG